VAFATSAFSDAVVAWFDAYRIREISSCECEGMPEAIVGFGKVFCRKTGWGMTVVAVCNRSMAALNPGIVMVLHDVAVGAGGRIVAKVRAAFSVNEGVSSDACG
jgi:hypothetical protein